MDPLRDGEGFASSPEDTGETQLTFEIGSTTLSLPARLVLEVMDRVETLPVPTAPRHILGVSKVRGRIVAVVDPHSVFGLDGTARTDEQGGLAVVVQHGDMTVALLVDRVIGVDPGGTDRGIAGMTRAALAPLSVGSWRRGDGEVVELDPGALFAAIRVRRSDNGEDT